MSLEDKLSDLKEGEENSIVSTGRCSLSGGDLHSTSKELCKGRSWFFGDWRVTKETNTLASGPYALLFATLLANRLVLSAFEFRGELWKVPPSEFSIVF